MRGSKILFSETTRSYHYYIFFLDLARERCPGLVAQRRDHRYVVTDLIDVGSKMRLITRLKNASNICMIPSNVLSCGCSVVFHDERQYLIKQSKAEQKIW